MMNAKGSASTPHEQRRGREGSIMMSAMSFVATIARVMPTMAVTAARQVKKRPTIARAVASGLRCAAQTSARMPNRQASVFKIVIGRASGGTTSMVAAAAAPTRAAPRGCAKRRQAEAMRAQGRSEKVDEGVARLGDQCSASTDGVQPPKRANPARTKVAMPQGTAASMLARAVGAQRGSPGRFGVRTQRHAPLALRKVRSTPERETPRGEPCRTSRGNRNRPVQTRR